MHSLPICHLLDKLLIEIKNGRSLKARKSDAGDMFDYYKIIVHDGYVDTYPQSSFESTILLKGLSGLGVIFLKAGGYTKKYHDHQLSQLQEDKVSKLEQEQMQISIELGKSQITYNKWTLILIIIATTLSIISTAISLYALRS